MSEPATPPADDVRTLTVTGEVDIASADDLVARARAVLAPAPTLLEVDLEAVTFMDSTGLGALVRVQKEAAERGVDLVLVRVPAIVTRLLDITGLDSVLDVRAES